MIHNDSVSRAFDRRMAFSSMRERMTSASVGLAIRSDLQGAINCVAEMYVPTDLKGRRCHGRELSDDLEDAIKLALW